MFDDPLAPVLGNSVSKLEGPARRSTAMSYDGVLPLDHSCTAGAHSPRGQASTVNLPAHSQQSDDKRSAAGVTVSPRRSAASWKVKTRGWIELWTEYGPRARYRGGRECSPPPSGGVREAGPMVATAS